MKVLRFIDDMHPEWEPYAVIPVIDDDNKVHDALYEAERQVHAWLKGHNLDEDYEDCTCDMEFYITALNKYECILNEEVEIEDYTI